MRDQGVWPYVLPGLSKSTCHSPSQAPPWAYIPSSLPSTLMLNRRTNDYEMKEVIPKYLISDAEYVLFLILILLILDCFNQIEDDKPE